MQRICSKQPWRNWYTRSTKDAVEQSLGVQVPLAAPKIYIATYIISKKYSCPKQKKSGIIFINKEMKGLNLFLASCFVVPVLNSASADVTKNSNRVQSSRGQTTTLSTSRATQQKRANTVSRTTTTTPAKNVVKRDNKTAPVEKTRAATTPTRKTSVVARTTSTKKQNTYLRPSAIFQTTKTPSRSLGLARAATETTKTRESVMQRDFSKCKTVFFDCMDEFCANKDAQLKRCACSSRSNEFKSTQKSLDNVEDKLLDFSQRLLKVNMDPADAAVINQESEGEKAYNETKDKTASRKTLDEIAKKLNTSFDSATSNNLGVLSWSLDADSAFDAVDSLNGVSTTAKSGTELKAAATPVCREMAAEVCSDEDLSLVEQSYSMSIEQDCNTVKRAYETQTQQAKNKILESSALLDMTRLNKYQDDNSDDILTCKSKMLTMLEDTNVCGDGLTKCLDISGRYVNPTTGEVFLSPELVNLSKLITRPTNNIDSWAKTPTNAQFVSYLNSKKKYLEPAMQNCQTIADNVWKEFMDDALAKIKLAQNAKLEEVRRSCTSLLTDCMDTAKTSLSEFDSRALSTFGVLTDKTVNALCDNVKTSCSIVMDYNPDTNEIATDTGTNDWTSGVTDIAAYETYNTIIETCREVGRDCIIKSCKSITGNFGLCESINESVNRHSILTRSSCWQDVLDCVAQASDKSINDIRHILPTSNVVPSALYEQSYGVPDVYDFCRNELDLCHAVDTTNDSNDRAETDCYRCRIAEQIWGNCHGKADNSSNNTIMQPTNPDSTTLLWWFAQNTHTQDDDNSCKVSSCPAGEIDVINAEGKLECLPEDQVLICSASNVDNIICSTKIDVNNNYKNCCESGILDNWGNCCMNGGRSTSVSNPLKLHFNSTQYEPLLQEYISNTHNGDSASLNSDQSTITNMHICTSSQSPTLFLVAKYKIQNQFGTNPNTNAHYDGYTYVFCDGTLSGGNIGDNAQIICNGSYITLTCSTMPIGSGQRTRCYYGSLTPGSTANNDGIYDANTDYTMNYFYYMNIPTATVGNDQSLQTYCKSSYYANYAHLVPTNSSSSPFHFVRHNGVEHQNNCPTIGYPSHDNISTTNIFHWLVKYGSKGHSCPANRPTNQFINGINADRSAD